jgi:hypothetical protein
MGHGNHGRHSRKIGDQEEGGFPLSLSVSVSLCAHSHGTQIKGEVYSHLWSVWSESMTVIQNNRPIVVKEMKLSRDGDRTEEREREREKQTNKQSNGRKLCRPFNKLKEMATQTNKQTNKQGEKCERCTRERERERETNKES